MHEELLLADILKVTKKSPLKKLKQIFRKNFYAYCDRDFGKKCPVSYIFQTIVVIVVIIILEKYW